jgi:hypothetical protein
MKALTASLAGLIGLYSTAFGAVWFLDSRYAPLAGFKELNWTLLKDAIREIRREIREHPDDESLQDDLDEYIDRLCREHPEDRDCHEAE